MNELSHIKGFLETQGLAVLSTISGTQPYCNLVAFAAVDDLSYLIFATKRNTRKYDNLRHNSKVSLLMDNRRNRVTDFDETTALTVMGEARELSDNRDDIELYLNKHPSLKNFASEPDCVLFKVVIESLVVASSIRQASTIRRETLD